MDTIIGATISYPSVGNVLFTFIFTLGLAVSLRIINSLLFRSCKLWLDPVRSQNIDFYGQYSMIRSYLKISENVYLIFKILFRLKYCYIITEWLFYINHFSLIIFYHSITDWALNYSALIAGAHTLSTAHARAQRIWQSQMS